MKVTTQLRLSEELYAMAKKIAEETGDSLNGSICHLINLGARLYQEGVIPQKK